MKWKPTDYNSVNPPKFIDWKPPRLIYPNTDTESDALIALKEAFAPLRSYKEMEAEAIETETLVEMSIAIPEGYIAFLENTAEQCSSPTTKHSQAGMQGARHWVQRVDTLEGIFRRLTDGYGISLMVGERCHQYIRNSNNWRGISGVLLDIDLFRDEKNPEAPEPVYSQSQLFDRYPLLARICTYLIPSASSLHDGRPFKARGLVLFPEVITDQRVYRAFGDLLCGELDCIPANVTKNPVAVGFGNTHNAPQAWQNASVDRHFIADAVRCAESTVKATTKQRQRERKHLAERKAHYQSQGTGTGEGENISAFIEQCDPVREMECAGLITRGRGNEYHWHESEHDRSCDILDGSIHIFSASMQAASPAGENEPVGAHRFYLYLLSGLDMTRDVDKPRIREFLFEQGYGSDPKAFTKKQQQAGVRKPVKLFKSEYAGMLSTLDKARSFLSEVFAKGAQFFAIRTDTGTGKTENAITYALTKDVAIPTLSGTLRDEIVGRARDKEMIAWGYRGIRDTDDSDDYLPCIESERFEMLRNKGFNPYKWVCENCPMRSECKQRGYLSQPERTRASQLVALPFPTAYLDPRLRNWARLYLPRGKDALILHDDLPLGSLFYEVRLSADRLRRISEEWKGTLAAEWAEACLMAFARRDVDRLRKISVELKGDPCQSVHYALTQCIDPLSGAVVEPDDYLVSPAVNFSTPDDCATLPQVDGDYDVATLLEMFFRRYPRVIDAPCYWDKASESFVFELPPKPYPFKKSLRYGFASATLQEQLINRIFPGIDFYDTALTEWVDGAEVFQLRTNRNPRATVLNIKEKYTHDGEKVWEYDGLNATGEAYYQSVIDFIKSQPNDRHAVFSYKCVIEEKHSELDSLGVVTAHFGDVAGLDTAFAGVKYFHLLFCPFVDPLSVENLAKQLFGNDEHPFLRDAEGKLERNADGTYAEERAQMCNDALVIGELRQGVGRARLNLYPNIVMIWTSQEIDGVSNRKETTLFDEVDYEQAASNEEGGRFTERLQAIVAKRENSERAIENAVAAGDVQAVKEHACVSRRTGERKTHASRKQNKAKRDAEVFRQYDAGMTQQDIADALYIGLATVNRILKKRDF